MLKGNNKKLKEELKDLQLAYDLAIKEINKLRAKRDYWENKYKKLEEKKWKIK